MYFATHVQGIGEHLKWSPFSCENILSRGAGPSLVICQDGIETACAILASGTTTGYTEAGQVGIPSTKSNLAFVILKKVRLTLLVTTLAKTNKFCLLHLL